MGSTAEMELEGEEEELVDAVEQRSMEGEVPDEEPADAAGASIWDSQQDVFSSNAKWRVDGIRLLRGHG